VSLFLMKFPVPLEFEAGYSHPLLGKNVPISLKTLSLQIKTYLKF
jgi:hypothetical protein